MLNAKQNIDVSAKQRLASDPNNNVYVSASAGTGKTKVLSDRVLRLMLNGSKIENILCLTFTNAAAAEMNERVMSRLKNWFICDDESLNSDLQNLTGAQPSEALLVRARKLYGECLRGYGKIKIQTIHSLCSALMGKDPENKTSLNVIENYQKNIIIKKAIEHVHQIKDKSMAAAREKLSQYFDYPKVIELFHEVVKNKIKFLNARANQIDVFALYGVDKNLSLEEIDDEFLQQIPANLHSIILGINESGDKAAARFLSAIDPFDLDKYIKCFYTQAGTPYKKFITLKTSGICPQAQDFFDAEIERIEEYKLKRNALISAEFHDAFMTVMDATFTKYEELKKQECVIEYDDFLLMTLQLLKGGSAQSILYNLDYSIDHLLVDEAQDLSPLQWELIKIIADEFFAGAGARAINRTIFIVGDYKQSIYSFQGANPQVFLDIKDYFAQKVLAAQKKWVEVELNTSFRTTSSVLGAVDEIFNDPYIKECIGVKESLRHIPFRVGKGCVQLWPLTLKNSASKESGWVIPSLEDIVHNPMKILAEEIASHIKNWLDSRRKLLGHNRQIQPRDILILFKKRSDAFYFIINELKKSGIDVSDADRFKMSEEIIIQDIMALLKYICFPKDDLNLACLLKSPFIGISEEKLYELAHNRKGFLIDEIELRDSDIFSRLNELTNACQTKVLDDYLIDLLEQNKGVFISRFGSKALVIFSNFIEVLKKYCGQNSTGIHGFIDYIENSNLEIKIEVGKSENKVRVMTAHNSKGLQAPVVILADTSASAQAPHTNLLWSENGLFFSTYKEFDTPYLATLKEITKQKEKEESMRLLYVAMTRAEDELYIAGWENQRQKDSWYTIFENKLESKEVNYSHAEVGQPEVIKKDFPAFLNEKVKSNAVSATFIKATQSAEIKTPEILRGEQIHFYLEIFSKMSSDAISKYIDGLPEKENALVAKNVVEKFPEIFSTNSMSEVGFIGRINGKNINVKMDRVIINVDEARVIDFKTGTRIDGKYKDQMDLYKSILENKYPNKKIFAQILWIDTLELEDV